MEDIDGYVYRSNASGEALREHLNGYDCAAGYGSERCRIVARPGFYLIEVEYYEALEIHYTGTAKIGPLRPAHSKPRRTRDGHPDDRPRGGGDGTGDPAIRREP
jgi:hypothetical protein